MNNLFLEFPRELDQAQIAALFVELAAEILNLNEDTELMDGSHRIATSFGEAFVRPNHED